MFATLLQGLVPGAGLRVPGSGFGVRGLGFRVQGSGFRVQGSGFGVKRVLRLTGRRGAGLPRAPCAHGAQGSGLGGNRLAPLLIGVRVASRVRCRANPA